MLPLPLLSLEGSGMEQASLHPWENSWPPRFVCFDSHLDSCVLSGNVAELLGERTLQGGFQGCNDARSIPDPSSESMRRGSTPIHSGCCVFSAHTLVTFSIPAPPAPSHPSTPIHSTSLLSFSSCCCSCLSRCSLSSRRLLPPSRHPSSWSTSRLMRLQHPHSCDLLFRASSPTSPPLPLLSSSTAAAGCWMM